MSKERFALYFRKYRTETIIFFVSFVVHLIASIFLYTKFGDNVLYFENEDAHSYVNLAKSLVAGEGFSYQGQPSATRTPVYPLILSVLFFLKLPFTWSVLILQNLAASLAGVFVYKIGRLFSERAGKIAGFVYVLEPYMIMTTNLATTETVFNLLIVIFFYYFVRWYSRIGRAKELYVSAVFLALANLTRPVLLYFPITVILGFVARVFIFKNAAKVTFRQGLVFFFIFAALLTPWYARQASQFGKVKLTNTDSYFLYFKISPLAYADKNNLSYNEATRELSEQIRMNFADFEAYKLDHTFAYDDWLVGRAGEIIRANPAPVAKLYVASVVPAMFGTGYEYMLENVAGIERTTVRPSYSTLFLERGASGLWQALKNFNLFLLTLFLSLFIWSAIYLVILFGTCRKIVWRSNGALIFLLIGIIGYFVFFSLGPASHARYRVPTFPFLFILLGLGLDFLRKKAIIRRNFYKT